jgi:superfamily I DNA and/or RNA helicase
VVLAGDHQQLPPTVKCVEAARQGLAKTLMETIVEQKPQAVTLLETQYRMNETLMRFSSQWFYGGRVHAAPGVRQRASILDLQRPLQWIDTSGMDAREHFVGDTYGRVNETEARLTLQTLCSLVERTGIGRIVEEGIDVGVISPYKAQVQRLRQLIRQEKRLRPMRQLITVNTVDGFQGQERDVIIISLVRSNDDGQIGFLSDLRRMNVAMTRARFQLIILGDAATIDTSQERSVSTQHKRGHNVRRHLPAQCSVMHLAPCSGLLHDSLSVETDPQITHLVLHQCTHILVFAC